MNEKDEKIVLSKVNSTLEVNNKVHLLSTFDSFPLIH